MLCILSFIIFLLLFPVLGFSKSYRVWFKKAWSCVLKKATLQPCQMSVGDELKSLLTSKLVLRFPTVAKFLRRTFTFWALVFVVLNLWTIWSVFNATLNLVVYDTCDRAYGQSCSLSGEACGVSSGQMGFVQAVQQGKIIDWLGDSSSDFFETLSLVPNRFRDWNPKDYVSTKTSYYSSFDQKKELVLEVLDPSCSACKKLFGRLKEAGVDQKYNLTYLLYPIPSTDEQSGYKFRASYLFASYVEALKYISEITGPDPNLKLLSTQEVASDWLLLEEMFTGVDEAGVPWQDGFNYSYKPEEFEQKIHLMIKKRVDLNEEQIEKIKNLAQSEVVKSSLQDQKNIVEQKIHTIRIPTLLFNNRRYDRVVELDVLLKP